MKPILLILVLLATGFAQQLIAQSIYGKVVDAQKHPVDFATVHIEGTLEAVYTDENGVFSLHPTVKGVQLLSITRVGYSAINMQLDIKGNLNLGTLVMQEQNQMEDVLVVGKSTLRKIKEQSFAVNAIDMKKLSNSAADLTQLVNRSAGVNVREEGGMGSGFSFNLNGFSGNQVKFFLDGVPLDNLGNSFGLANLSPNMIRQIEVYKGVLPVSLASDALGGAVNIVTRNDANYLDLSYTVGSFNTHKVSLNGAFTNQKGFTVRSNFFYNFSDNNYKVYVPIVDLDSKEILRHQWARRFHDQFQGAGVKLEAGWQDKRWADQFLLGIIASGYNKDVQNGVTMERVFGAITSSSNTLAPSLTYSKKGLLNEKLDLNAHIRYSINEYQYIDTTALRYNWLGESVPQSSATSGEDIRSRLKIKDNELIMLANGTYHLTNRMNLALNYKYARVDRDLSDKEDPENPEFLIPQSIDKHTSGLGWELKEKRWNVALFGKLYAMKGNSFEYVDQFLPTQRLESFTNTMVKPGYGTALSWYFLPGWQLKGSYEQTYRLPDAIELFGDGLFNKRNPNLKPESSHNVNTNLLFDQFFQGHHHLSAEAGMVWRKSKDFIQKELSDPSTQYINLGEVLTTGVEANIRYEFRKLFHAGGNITYQKITDNMEYITISNSLGTTSRKNLTYKDQLPNLPYLFGNWNVGMNFEDLWVKRSALTVDYYLDYVHDFYLAWPSLGSAATKSVIPRQIAHSVAATYSLAKGRYNISVECRNIGNAKLYDNYLLQKPGRAFFLKLRYTIM